MADMLPECLIHKILSFLSFKEATKMSLLSKTWLQASLTLPNWKFKVDHRKVNIKIVDAIMARYRDGKIPIDKFELSFSVDSCQLIDKWLVIILQNGVKEFVLVRGCILMPVTLSRKCDSLSKLSLSCVRLDENMLQTLLNSCPMIVTFVLEYCDGLEKIELLILQKIKSVSIRTRRHQRLTIQALTLEHLSCNSSSSAKLHVVKCQNLKSLDLYVRTFDGFPYKGFLHNLISRSSQSPKVVNIQYCGAMKKIDAPNNLLLYHTNSIPQVDVLNVNILCPDKECSTLLDALL